MGPLQPATRKCSPGLGEDPIEGQDALEPIQLTAYSTTATETAYANGTATAYVNATVTDSYT